MKILFRPVEESSRRMMSSLVEPKACVFEQEFEIRIRSNRKQAFNRSAFSS